MSKDDIDKADKAAEAFAGWIFEEIVRWQVRDSRYNKEAKRLSCVVSLLWINKDLSCSRCYI